MSSQYPFPHPPSHSAQTPSSGTSTSSTALADMRTPRFLQSAKEHLRHRAVQARISSAKSLLSATKDYLVTKDYRAAYADVSDRVRSAVSTARVMAAQAGTEEGSAAMAGWVGRRRQSWGDWARERRRRRQEEQRGTERVWLFPGWAIRRPVAAAGLSARQLKAKEVGREGEGAFDLELRVMGYCTSLRPPEQASRSQRAFMRLARSFSSLPRLPATGAGSGSDSASLGSFESSTPPSGTASPLMSPLLRAVISEEPGEDVDLINLDSPGGSGTSTPKELQLDNLEKMDKLGGEFFTSNGNSKGRVRKDSLPSPAEEMAGWELPPLLLPQPAAGFGAGGDGLAAPAIALQKSTPSPQPGQPAPIPPKPAALPSSSSSSSSSSSPAGVGGRSLSAPTLHPYAPKAPSPLSSPSLGPTHPPHATPHRTSPRRAPSPSRKSASLSQTTTTSADYTNIPPDELRTLHANLEARLQPFWASVLAMRKVRVVVALPPPAHPIPEDASSPRSVLAQLAPEEAGTVTLLETEVTTNHTGLFDERITVAWERIVQALQKVGGDMSRLEAVEVRAEVVPSPIIPNPLPSSSPAPAPAPAHPTQLSPPELYPLPPSPSLRLISDIDDTIKHTGVLLGAKQVFNNVFVRHLDELVIPGVASWYEEMSEWGVGFHYVSNSPYQLLPVVREFMDLAGFPAGSIKLKYYSPSAVFTGLWDSAADRKRASVSEVMDAFPSAKFILVGDTGEQDMELYVQLAQERPGQVVGIFLRDVTPPAWTEGWDDQTPAGQERRPFRRSLSGLSLASTASLSASLPIGGSPLSSPTLEPTRPRRSSTTPNSSNPPSPSSLPLTAPTPQSPSMPSSVAYLSPSAATQTPPVAQLKAGGAWRTRLAAARRAVPEGVAFRLFREVGECEEWRGLVERFGGGA